MQVVATTETAFYACTYSSKGMLVEKQIKKCSSASLAILETKKSAFKDNLLIWEYDGAYSNGQY